MLDNMVRKWSIEDFRSLSVDERLELIGDLWESIENESLPPLTEAQQKELERRLEEHHQDPSSALSWEQVEADVLNRLKQIQ